MVGHVGVLAITTERGQQWVALQQDTARRLAEAWHAEAIGTGDDRAALVDALFVRHGVVVGVAEIKVRSMTVARLEAFGDYLVTAQKLTDGMRVATALQVPYVLAVRLEDAIVWWRLTDAKGRTLVTYPVRETVTQETCLGGTVARPNAYLPLDKMARLPISVTAFPRPKGSTLRMVADIGVNRAPVEPVARRIVENTGL